MCQRGTYCAGNISLALLHDRLAHVDEALVHPSLVGCADEESSSIEIASEHPDGLSLADVMLVGRHVSHVPTEFRQTLEPTLSSQREVGGEDVLVAFKLHKSNVTLMPRHFFYGIKKRSNLSVIALLYPRYDKKAV